MWYTCVQWNITQPLKRNEILPFVATRMDLEGNMPSEINQTEKQIPYNFIYMCNLKKQKK